MQGLPMLFVMQPKKEIDHRVERKRNLFGRGILIGLQLPYFCRHFLLAVLSAEGCGARREPMVETLDGALELLDGDIEDVLRLRDVIEKYNKCLCFQEGQQKGNLKKKW